MRLCDTCGAPTNTPKRGKCGKCLYKRAARRKTLSNMRDKGLLIPDPQKRVELLAMAIQTGETIYWCDCCSTLSITNKHCENQKEVGFVNANNV